MRKSFVRIARWLPVLAVAIGLSNLAHANTGALLPLDQYQAGTEQVQNTIVANGNFEAPLGPTNWQLNGTSSFNTGTPTGPNTSAAVNGAKAAQGPLGNTQLRSELLQSVSLTANTDYFLSGYAWNFSLPNSFDLVLVELRDGNGNVKNFSLAPNDNSTGPQIDGSRGVFGYKSFNSGAFTGAVTLAVAFEYDYNTTNTPGTRPNIAAQVDNVAITPSAQFQPPQAVPEPASLGAIALAGIFAMRRRR
jgi:hypothetical protein